MNDVELVASSCEFSFLLSLKILAPRCDRNMSLSVSSSSVFSDSCASVHNTLPSLWSDRLPGRYGLCSSGVGCDVQTVSASEGGTAAAGISLFMEQEFHVDEWNCQGRSRRGTETLSY